MTVTTGNFGGKPYRELEELVEELDAVILRYQLRVPTLGVIGALALLQQVVTMRQIENQ